MLLRRRSTGSRSKINILLPGHVSLKKPPLASTSLCADASPTNRLSGMRPNCLLYAVVPASNLFIDEKMASPVWCGWSTLNGKTSGCFEM